MHLATLLPLLGLPSSPTHYPIPPRPLRLLVEEAEFIVTARVVEADRWTRQRVLAREERPDGFGPHEVVVLEIDGLVKNDPGTGWIAQPLYGRRCPAPPRYVVGTRVLAFLDREEDGPGFTTHALSYGAKTLDGPAMTVYLECIRGQLEIEQMPEGETRTAAQVEWLVKCAEHPATRWEGAYELARAGDFMSHYEREDLDGIPPDFASRLTSSQRDRLRDAFLKAEDFESGERCLDELFRDDPDPRLQAWLVAQLRRHDEEVEEESYVASTLIKRIARRDSRSRVRELAAAFEAKRSFDRDGGDGQGRLAIVRELLDLF